MMKRLTALALVVGLTGAAFGDMWIAPAGVGSFVPDPGSNAREISFSNGIAFDTRYGEPGLPAGYRSNPQATGAYLVQFSGPVQERWVDELVRAGAIIYSYIPNYSFLVRMNETALVKVRTLKQVVWVGPYHPAYKVAETRLFQATGQSSLVMMLYPDADIEAAARSVQSLGGVIKEKTVSDYAKVIRANLDLSKVVDLANLPEVMALHSWSGEPRILNNNAQWVTQQGWLATAPPDTSLTYRPIWRRGIQGQGQIVSYHDTGISVQHCTIRDPAVPITAAGDYPTHRKVVAYKVYPGAAFGDASGAGYHGSHVGGTIAGNDLGVTYYNGMAKEARINFTDVGDANGGIVVASDLTTLFDLTMQGNAAGPVLQHSGSWGWNSSIGDYLIQEASADAWHWRNKLVLPIFAAGGGAIARTVVHPAIAKNVLTIGTTGSSTSCNVLASFSSRGPTQDNRVKPTVCAPGNPVMSVDGPTACSYKSMSGASMATAAANGSLVLVRQYFHEGWYPTGTPRSADTLDPSAALMRAMAICSGDSNVSGYAPPNFNTGFGRLNLDSVLYFDTLGTDSRKLAVVDNRTGVATGQYIQYAVTVTDSSLPLRVALAWVDTAAAVNANPTLVNDLNLEILDPAGTTYRGNQMSGWRSTANPTTWDDRNVEEIARIVSPRTGQWLIRVRGQNAPQGARVWFGLVVTGGLAPGISGIGGERITERPKAARIQLGKVIPNPTNGETRIEYTLPEPRDVTLRAYNSTGQLVRELVNGKVEAGQWAVTWNGRDGSGQRVPGGIYVLRLSAGKESLSKRMVLLR
jgi:hypothetical protein